MPNTTKKNPDADFTGRRMINRLTGKAERPSRTKGVTFGGRFYATNVPEEIDYRFKTKRLGGRRAAARSRSALTIPFDFEKPVPKF